MLQSDKNMGKIKGSNKPFEGKEKAPWNKGINKKKNTKKRKFPPQRKEILNNCNIGKPWFDHDLIIGCLRISVLLKYKNCFYRVKFYQLTK